MATEDLYTSRPEIQSQSFTPQPKYVSHKPYEDKLAILVCQIKIWQAKDKKWFDIPEVGKCLVIRECESIEVNDSVKDLVGKAVVKFPRGTVISKSSDKDKKVSVGTEANATDAKSTLGKATNDGDVITTQTAVGTDGESVTSIAPRYDDKGLIDFNRTATEKALLSPNDVAIGNRIEIRVGYAYSQTEFDKMNSADSHENLDIVFSGFITSISVDTPLSLECTNMAHVLACISAPDIPSSSGLTVKDFLDDDGQYRILKKTGIELDEISKKSNIQVVGGNITSNITVAEVLNAWAEGGVMSRMVMQKDGTVKLRVGLNYCVGSGGSGLPTKDKKYITYKEDSSVHIIQFDWDVAQDKLGLMRNDKKYLAVKAIGRDGDNIIRLTIRKNPDIDDIGDTSDAGDGFQIVNEHDLVKKKAQKRANGTRGKAKKLEDRMKLNKYNVVTYISPVLKGMTKQRLIEEAKQYWHNYVPNGISGSIEIFGDVMVQPTDIVGFIDMRQPEKNGYYYVESVSTTFGMNGYRRELKVPFKMAAINKITII